MSSTFERIAWTPLPEIEAADTAAFDESADRLIDADRIFIVRGDPELTLPPASGRGSRRADVPTEWESLAMTRGSVVAAAAVRSQLWASPEGKIVRGFQGFGQKPIGRFHTDHTVDKSGSTKRVNVLTVASGGGNVIFGPMGTQPELAEDQQRYGPFIGWRGRFDRSHPHQLLKRGLVDPRLVSPHMFRGVLEVGDSVCSVESGPGASWHRFDTNRALGKRAVQVFLLTLGRSLQ